VAPEHRRRLFALARERLEPGALVIADDVILHADQLAAYSTARRADPTLLSVTVPLDRGLELSVVLRWPRSSLSCDYRGKEVVRQ
jgi:predicted O-methyltransferase YrrM